MNVWITGASTGIGAELALLMAERGDTVIISARSQDKLEALCKRSETLPGTLISLPLDVTDTQAAAQTLRDIEARGLSLDLAVLNAGYYEPLGIADLTVEHFERTYAVNLHGIVNCLVPVLKGFVSRRAGHIALVGSVSGYSGLPRAAAYGSSKAALINLAESLVPECERHGVRMSLVSPGFVKSPLTDLNDFPMPFIMETQDAARRLLKGLDGGAFETTFPRRFTWWLKLLRLLPYRLYFVVSRKLLG